MFMGIEGSEYNRLMLNGRAYHTCSPGLDIWSWAANQLQPAIVIVLTDVTLSYMRPVAVATLPAHPEDPSRPEKLWISRPLHRVRATLRIFSHNIDSCRSISFDNMASLVRSMQRRGIISPQ